MKYMKMDPNYNPLQHLEDENEEMACALELMAQQIKEQAGIIHQMIKFESNVADVITALEKRIQYLENNG